MLSLLFVFVQTAVVVVDDWIEVGFRMHIFFIALSTSDVEGMFNRKPWTAGLRRIAYRTGLRYGSKVGRNMGTGEYVVVVVVVVVAMRGSILIVRENRSSSSGTTSTNCPHGEDGDKAPASCCSVRASRRRKGLGDSSQSTPPASWVRDKDGVAFRVKTRFLTLMLAQQLVRGKDGRVEEEEEGDDDNNNAALSTNG